MRGSFRLGSSLVFTAAMRLGPNDPSVSKIVDATEYVAAVPWTWLRENF
jgi:hypothetical protein